MFTFGLPLGPAAEGYGEPLSHTPESVGKLTQGERPEFLRRTDELIS
jgi:hypothetical protein